MKHANGIFCNIAMKGEASSLKSTAANQLIIFKRRVLNSYNKSECQAEFPYNQALLHIVPVYEIHYNQASFHIGLHAAQNLNKNYDTLIIIEITMTSILICGVSTVLKRFYGITSYKS